MIPLAIKQILSKVVNFSKIDNFFLLEKCVLKSFWTAKIKPRQIECSVFFKWSTTDELEFEDWSKVNQMFVCGEITIFLQRLMI